MVILWTKVVLWLSLVSLFFCGASGMLERSSGHGLECTLDVKSRDDRLASHGSLCSYLACQCRARPGCDAAHERAPRSVKQDGLICSRTTRLENIWRGTTLTLSSGGTDATMEIIIPYDLPF